ncbi:MAG TPA: aminotransferase class III-fold pyridoxal phosphate-dependent enzyme [Candidatus Hydrogenedentes bacterium]|jgi:glutamate-1-semialdehyde 2,1-aminomutase|nr:aminotransferase class III-fold pyridoxal phosphate-dependent enzyme [Candidatus Hydrogenedentota bacterium]
MSGHWTITGYDEALAGELAALLPPKLFDVHAHVYRVRDLNTPGLALLEEGPHEASIAVWRERLSALLPGPVLTDGLFFPFVARHCDNAAANAFLAGQLQANAGSRGLAIVTPDMTRDEGEALLDRPGMAGFKPYHCYARREDTGNAAIGEYLPGWVWELCHERGGVIMLHLVRPGALSDPDNLADIQRNGRDYPNAKLVLAHAARGFHAPNTVRAIGSLRGLENVWFDSSAICESAPLLAILEAFGPRRLLWGSDFPVCFQRGRCVTAGDGFFWLGPEHIDTASPFAPRLALTGLESLRALREAADTFGLDQDDLRDVFHDNAGRLLGLAPATENVTQERYTCAKQHIPGGTQLLSKRPEMFAPGQWPAYYREARGCEVWDLDGRHYYDLSIHGIGASLLGYADPDVTRAVKRRVALGSWSTLNPPEEAALADRLFAIHPWANQARYTRTGGEAAAVAVRIARATTGRSHVAICGYHGWHDWYLAANLGEDDSLDGHLLPGLKPRGVPGELRGTAHTFRHGSREEFQAILDQFGGRLAAVVLEPCRHHDPEPGFLEFVRDGAHRHGALLIFDEITIGWRLHFGGAHLRFGVHPDMALFAKTLSNGHPMAAVIGTRDAMEGAHESFISSSYWTEGVGPVAALATLNKMERTRVWEHAERTGQRIKAIWASHAQAHGLPVTVDGGYPCLAHFAFDHPDATALRTYYTQQMLERGFLAGTAVYATLAHSAAIVDRFEEAVDASFAALAAALAEGTLLRRLNGPLAHSGFARLVK